MARDSDRQVRELWGSLAPRRWPLPPASLPAGTALVGGAVRDALLGRLALRPDLDFVVEREAVALTRDLACRLGGTCVVLDAERSIARLVIGGWTIDLARCAGADLRADLGRRDYTVNAIALPLPGGEPVPAEGSGEAPPGLVDPHDGVGDLRRGRLVAIAEANLLDDPLRLLRGIRLSAELGFSIDPQTWRWITTHRHRLDEVAGERVLAELERIAAAPQGQQGLLRIRGAGLLEALGGAASEDAATRTLGRLTPLRAQETGLAEAEIQRWLPLARLALATTPGLLRRLPTSRHLRERCSSLHRWWEELPHPSRGQPALESLDEKRRLALHHSLEEDLPALLLLLDPPEAASALQRWRDPLDPLFHPRSPLDGHTLQRLLGLGPGRDLGDLIDHLTLERAFGRLPAFPPGGAEALTEIPPEILEEARRWLKGRGMRHDGR